MKKKNLQPINNLKLIIRDIRGYMAGNATGITRDETIVQNLMLIIFCKIYDEISKDLDSDVEFYGNLNDSDKLIHLKINTLFEKVKEKYSDIFNKKDRINFFEKDLTYVVRKIQDYSLTQTQRDVIADVFEELIGVAFRGGEGQFFTPKNVVSLMVNIIEPNDREKVIDPACGSAGFLVNSYLHTLQHNKYGNEFYGIEKDGFLSKISKIYLAVLGLVSSRIVCENSLVNPEEWSKETQSQFGLGKFDVVITNPPFGAKIPIKGVEILSQFELGHVWTANKNKSWKMTDKLFDKQPPQILFIERIINLLKEGGRAAIVLPDGIFGNKSDRYVWEYLRSHCKIDGVISLAQEAFMPSTHTKTSVLFITKGKTIKSYKIFMAIANTVGHDKNGNVLYKFDRYGEPQIDKMGSKIIDDDLPEILEKFKQFKSGSPFVESTKGFVVSSNEIINHIYVPSVYFENKNESIDKNLYEFFTINELIEKGIIKISRGHEIGSRFYGTGEIPFIRTTDIVNWEIKSDTVKTVSDEVYNLYKSKQNIQAGDILFVNDGTFLIGRTAMISKFDTKSIIQSHLKLIKIKDDSWINNYYLFFLLNSSVVQNQVKSKTFVQATLSTLGDRLFEISLPIHKDKKVIELISLKVKRIFQQKEQIKGDIESLFDTNSII